LTPIGLVLAGVVIVPLQVNPHLRIDGVEFVSALTGGQRLLDAAY